MLIFFYFPNGRYTECLSLTCATNKSKPKKRKKLHFKNKKKQKKGNIQGKYKVLMLKGSHKKNSNNKITKSIFHDFCPGLQKFKNQDI